MNAFSYMVKDKEFFIALELRHSVGIGRTERTGYRISLFLGYQTIFNVVVRGFTW